ncbi:hypothetical protein CDAR_74641 [Caerostris darwini]|uniref:Uncharacterized protein n=1 Tax=Caerostris darwini TaxID=1538125 RepID=A0AAV4P3Y2_9ARAC|nr:hypothetical protein CDAR_74641 [Caerostris darwini]
MTTRKCPPLARKKSHLRHEKHLFVTTVPSSSCHGLEAPENTACISRGQFPGNGLLGNGPSGGGGEGSRQHVGHEMIST